MKFIYNIIGWSVGLALLSSCSTTEIVSTYEKPDSDQLYTSLYVVGIGGEALPEDKMENDLVNELEDEGFVAAADTDVFNPKMEVSDGNRDRVVDELIERGFDGLLTFSLISIEDEVDFNVGTYAPGMYPVTGTPYNAYWRYYGYYAPQAYATGYYTKNTVYHLEANLYDTESGERIWGVRSRAVDPRRAEILSEDFADVITDELEESGIIMSKDETAMK
jgi:hypothetical protein